MKSAMHNAIQKNMNIMNDSEEILAEFFGVDVSEIRVWSDGSMTIESKSDTVDYYVESYEVDGYSVIGKVGEMLVQSNG